MFGPRSVPSNSVSCQNDSQGQFGGGFATWQRPPNEPWGENASYTDPRWFYT